jgi:hypothetical protein
MTPARQPETIPCGFKRFNRLLEQADAISRANQENGNG